MCSSSSNVIQTVSCVNLQVETLLTWLSTLASLEYPNPKRSLAHAVSKDETGNGEGYGQEDAEKGEDGFFRPSGCVRGYAL